MQENEMLKKYKELLDSNVITQEEFEQKRTELLSGDMSGSSEVTAETENNSADLPKKVLGDKRTKLIAIAIGVIVLVIVSIIFIKPIVEENIKKNDQSTRAAALLEEIEPIMEDYGFDVYDIKYVEYFPELYVEGFEKFSCGEALAFLKELDAVSIDDPCGKLMRVDFGPMTHVHPGLDVDYSYWRVSSATVVLNMTSGGNYTTPGIYCDSNGTEECIFECEN